MTREAGYHRERATIIPLNAQDLHRLVDRFLVPNPIDGYTSCASAARSNPRWTLA